MSRSLPEGTDSQPGVPVRGLGDHLDLLGQNRVVDQAELGTLRENLDQLADTVRVEVKLLTATRGATPRRSERCLHLVGIVHDADHAEGRRRRQFLERFGGGNHLGLVEDDEPSAVRWGVLSTIHQDEERRAWYLADPEDDRVADTDTARLRRRTLPPSSSRIH